VERTLPPRQLEAAIMVLRLGADPEENIDSGPQTAPSAACGYTFAALKRPIRSAILGEATAPLRPKRPTGKGH